MLKKAEDINLLHRSSLVTGDRGLCKPAICETVWVILHAKAVVVSRKFNLQNRLPPFRAKMLHKKANERGDRTMKSIRPPTKRNRLDESINGWPMEIFKATSTPPNDHFPINSWPARIRANNNGR